MKFALTFTGACLINIMLFIGMMQMITADQKKTWIRTTSGDFFDFIRHTAKAEAIPRRPAKTPPKPEPEPEDTSALLTPTPNQSAEVAEMRALPLPVAALKVDIPLSGGINVGTGPALPRVVAGGQSKTGALGSATGAHYGISRPKFLLADQLTAIVKTQPHYPQALRFRRIEGEVWVEFTVKPDGSVTDAEVIKSSPQGSFDRTSLRAVRRWRFQPHRNEQGQAVAVRVRQHFIFKLH
ncbi:energy transducer TonB [Methylomarinum vadi]|uniref:energy transducer TonB n=1 Tax=Methylomarinum vadi TaxID=438855 RepID=UPI0004DF79BB|nr:energy transducer TonB [Methylomarinum vadi]